MNALPRKAKNRQRVFPKAAEQVRAIYRKLAQEWGPQHWWPAESPFEVIVGAILTQNTSWTNVERAMSSLRQAGVLSMEEIRNITVAQLEPLVRSSGYFRQKAQRLKNFVAFVDARYCGSLERMFAIRTGELRTALLEQKGIGMETADSILLYAGRHAIFVVDAYTRRILQRHGVLSESAKYDDIRLLVEGALAQEAIPPPATGPDFNTRPKVHAPSTMSGARQSARVGVYNEMHGLLVQVGKHYCHKQGPECDRCPLTEFLSAEQRVRVQIASKK